ncbi:trypsin-like serine peptidase [Loktanella sp. M215]|uniref:trypsin-like serine peptidase n=1 Tax=Loktanella sp. M215 TaxID=2675431 RepID=UPI001F2A51BE|nr:serine protease [Loktanella sp. M215]MCF7702334.1 trypsin-like serine protease [Loktanella sp. M215]
MIAVGRGFPLACAMLMAGPGLAQDDTPVTPAPAPVLEASVDGRIDRLDIRIGAAQFGAPPVLWTDSIAVAGADYIRLLIRVEGDFGPEAILRILPALGPASEVHLDHIDPEGLWTDLFPLGRATLLLLAPDPPAKAVLVLDSIAVEAKGGELFSAWGANDIMPVHDPAVPPAVAGVAQAVAWLSFIDGGASRACTGVLIRSDLLLTNQHCIASDAACASMRAIFGYEYDAAGRLNMGPQIGCAGFDPAWSDFALDVTALRLTGSPGADYAPISLPDMDPGAEALHGPLFIVQHPGPHPKQVSFIDCGAAASPVDGRAAASDFTHTCDTAEGSSGAPVFNAAGQLVGLHHFGFRDGSADIWHENRAVLAPLIVPWLQATVLSAPVARASE